MAIPPVKVGGWGPNFVPQPQELAQLDQELATKGLDAVGGDIVTGTLSVSGGAGIQTSLNITSAGAVAGSGPGGGNLTFSTGVGPTYSPARSRSVWISPLELCRSFPKVGVSGGHNQLQGGNLPYIDSQSGGITQYPKGSTVFTAGYIIAPNAQMVFPLTKPMNGFVNGATLTQVDFCYYMPNPSFVTGSGNGNLLVMKTKKDASTTTTLGTNAFTAGAIPNFASVASVTGMSEVIDLTTWIYHLVVIDPDYFTALKGPPGIIWTGFKIYYTSIANEGLQQ